MAVDHDRARELQARGDRLRELLDNPPVARELIPNLPEMADWIDAVVAAHKESTDG